MFTCKGICKMIKATKPPVGTSRYELGQKLCRLCDVFMSGSDTRCPCCGCRLRTGPRSTKNRKQLEKYSSKFRY